LGYLPWRIWWIKQHHVGKLATLAKHGQEIVGLHVVLRRCVGVQIVGDRAHLGVSGKRIDDNGPFGNPPRQQVSDWPDGERVRAGHCPPSGYGVTRCHFPPLSASISPIASMIDL